MCVYILAPDHVMIAPQLAVPFLKTTSRVDFLHRNYLNIKSFSWEFNSWSSMSLFNFVTSLHFFIRTSYKTILHYYHTCPELVELIYFVYSRNEYVFCWFFVLYKRFFYSYHYEIHQSWKSLEKGGIFHRSWFILI